ncbi:unnamed protein product [Symbiodinium sp. KB8]|nr:unnamed protein product [Symbiodinium sp. KB8]
MMVMMQVQMMAMMDPVLQPKAAKVMSFVQGQVGAGKGCDGTATLSQYAILSGFGLVNICDASDLNMAFTPIESGVGGLLIGLSAALAYLGDGKITGISGIAGPFLRGVGKCQPMKEGQLWKALFLVGLLSGGLLNLAFNRDFAYPQALDISVVRYCLGGVFVGIGTRAGRGCTWWLSRLQSLDGQGHHGPASARDAGAKFDRWWGQALGFMTAILAAFIFRDDDFNWYLGTRVGEASNPGPASARATRRKREGINMGSIFGEGGLEALIKPIIEKVIREIINKLFKNGGIAQLAEKEIVNRAAGGSGELLGERTSNSAASDVNKPKNKGGKGGKGNADAVGKGKGRAADDPGQADRDYGPGAAKGKGKNKGKAKGADVVPKPADDAEMDGGWEEVPARRPLWQLRGQDWRDPVMVYDEVAGEIGKIEGDKIFRAVIQCEREQISALQAMLAGSGKQHAVLLITCDKGPQSQRCPGSAGGKLTFRQVAFTRIASRGLVCPTPKCTTSAFQYDAVATTVLYAKFHQKFMPKSDWDACVLHPQRAFHTWLAKQHLKALDSWAWQVEKVDAVHSKVFGCVRVQEKDVEATMAASGQGVFIEAGRGSKALPYTVEWLDQDDKETAHEYIRRALTTKPELGLVAGRRQLGQRRKRDANTPVCRVWVLEGAPRAFSTDQALEVLRTTFTSVELLRQHTRRGGTDFIFKGATAEDTDSFAVPLQVKDGVIMLWARLAPPRSHPGQAQYLRTTGSWSLQAPAKPFDKAVPVAPEPPVTNGDGGPAAPASTEPDSLPDGKKRGPSTSAEVPNSKKAAAPQRALPKGVRIEHIEKDGNCCFAAVAAGVAEFDKSDAKPSLQVRAEVVAHLRKNSASYQKQWDHELPDRSASTSFEQYCNSISVDKTWGGVLELRAMARMNDARIVVIPASMQMEPFVIHPKQKRRVLCLWFTGSHFDRIVPNTGNDLPQSILAISAAPPEVPTRGGGDGSASVGARSRQTVWTTSSAGPSGGPGISDKAVARGEGTVWTEDTAGTDMELDDFEGVMHCEARPAKSRYVDRRGGHVFRCELCPYMVRHDNASRCATQGSKHMLRVHNITRKAPRPKVQLCVVRKNMQGGWRCPLCRKGLRPEDLDRITAFHFKQLKAAHQAGTPTWVATGALPLPTDHWHPAWLHAWSLPRLQQLRP